MQNVGLWGACFAYTTKTARKSVVGGEIIQNVGSWGGVAYMYIHILNRHVRTEHGPALRDVDGSSSGG